MTKSITAFPSILPMRCQRLAAVPSLTGQFMSSDFVIMVRAERWAKLELTHTFPTARASILEASTCAIYGKDIIA
jgi:hypothetical protein